MESNIKITMDNLNHSKTVNYNNKLNKLNKVNSSENYSYGKKSLYNKTDKQSIKIRNNKFTMTGTNNANNSMESIESDDSSETKIKLFEKLEKEEEDFIKNVLKSNKILMQELDDDAIDQFAEGFYCVEFQKGQILFNEGNEAKIFYIVFSGKVLIYNEDEDKIEKIRNKTNINKINNFILDDNYNSNTNPFSILHPKTIEEKNNDNIINNNNLVITNYNKHKKSDTFSGIFSLNSAKGRKELIKGCYFGQECFKENEVRMHNAKVLEKSKIFCCSGEFYRTAKNYMLLKISKQRMQLLNKISLFKYIEENKLISLSKKLKESKYNYCSIIINENEMNNTIYVVKEG
jgi:CRP-like cAMP-binding protein